MNDVTQDPSFSVGLDHVTRGQQLAAEDDLSGAERSFREAALSDNPAIAAIGAGELGGLFWRQGMEDPAITWWETSIASGHSAAASLSAYNLGVARRQRGEVAEAERA